MAKFLKLNNGYSMPTVGLGTWQAGPGEVYDAVQLAIDLGYRHFDCAMLYGNEAEIGRAICDKISKGDIKREDLFITSKLWNTFHRPDLVIPTCKKSLKNFGLEYLDLYLIHWPISYKQGVDDFWPRDDKGSLLHEYVDYLDTWREMEKCVSLGLVRSIGLSNFNSQQIDKVLEIATIKPVNNQVECHIYLNQKKLISFCKDRDITVTAYSPLGAPNAKFAPKNFPILLQDDQLKKIAERYNKTTAQLVLRYLVQNGVSVIPKSTNEKRLKQNIDIFDFNITSEDMTLLDSFNKNARTCPFTESVSDKNYPFSIEF